MVHIWYQGFVLDRIVSRKNQYPPPAESIKTWLCSEKNRLACGAAKWAWAPHKKRTETAATAAAPVDTVVAAAVAERPSI